MSRTITQALSAAALLIAASGDLRAQEHGSPPQLSALRRDLVCAESPADAGKALAALFGPARTNREWLARLQADSDAGMALQAAWEAAKDPGNGLAPRPQRFLGFLDGRLGLHAPVQWEVDIVARCFGDRQAAMNAALREYLPVAPFLRRLEDGTVGYHHERRRKTGLDLFALPGTVLKEDGDAVIITVGRASTSVPGVALRQARKDHPVADEVDAYLDAERLVIALHDVTGIAFPLLCLEARSGKLLWRAEAWGYRGDKILGPLTGLWRHDIAIAVTEKFVALFEDGNGCSLEAFDLRTGRPAFRFSADYWLYQKK
jgi:hypothetical protein